MSKQHLPKYTLGITASSLRKQNYPKQVGVAQWRQHAYSPYTHLSSPLQI